MNLVVYTNLFLLHAVGSLAIFSASGDITMVIKQTIFFGLGTAMFWMLQSRWIKSEWLDLTPKKVIGVYIGCIAMLVLVLLIGREVKGAKRWISLGPVALQPTEFLKVFFVGYFAYLLHATRTKYATKKWAEGPALMSFGLLSVLVLAEPDYGTFGLLLCVFAGMAFMSGLPLKKVAVYGGLAVLLVLTTVGTANYRSRRIEAYKNPWKYRYDAGYQTTSSYKALGAGNWLGVGYRNGNYKGSSLPEAHNDYIASVIGEETGFLGLSVVVSLYLALFGYLIYSGARLLVGWRQLFVAGAVLCGVGAVGMNLYVASGILPSKGSALPMISSGGSNLLGFMLLIAMAVRVTRDGLASKQEVAA